MKKNLPFSKTLLLSLVCIVYTLAAHAQCTWNPVGPDDKNQASYGKVLQTSITTDVNGVNYLAFSDGDHENKMTVRKFNGIRWEPVGAPGFSDGYITFPSIAVDTFGTPYVAYKDSANGNKATVMKFNGADWVTVGAAGFSAGKIFYASLAIDPSGTPNVAYKDAGNNNKATVMKFNGTSWVNVGMPGFSAGQADYTSLAINSTGVPYIAYQDAGNGNKVTVMKFNGTNWETTGTAGFSANPAKHISLKVNASDIPYVAFESGDIYVMKFDHNQWTEIGDIYSVIQGTLSLDLAIDTSGAPYVTYCILYGLYYGTKVIKYNGKEWEQLGSQIMEALSPSITIGASGIPYIVFTNEYNYTESKATVMNFHDGAWEVVGTEGVSVRGNISPSALTLSKTGVPYVVYSRITWLDNFQAKTYVKKFDGMNWDTLGISFWDAMINPCSIAIDSSDTPYVAFTSTPSTSVYPIVKKFDGTNWVSVGNMSDVTSSRFISFTLDVAGNPFIAYEDVRKGGITVRKFNGTDWVIVGAAGFSSAVSDYISLAIDTLGNPWVAYKDMDHSKKITVMKFNGTIWEIVGTAGFSAGEVQYVSLALDSSNIPFVAYKDVVNGNKATVMKFNGTAWIAVGAAGFSAGEIDNLSFAVNVSSATPYVAFMDKTNGNKATVMKFDGSNWNTVNSAGFTAGQTTHTAITLDSSGNPYLLGAEHGDVFVFKYLNMPNLDPIAGTQTLCAGSSATYSVNDIPGASYTWSLPSGWSGTSGTHTISIIAGTDGGTVSVFATGSCGNTLIQTINVVVQEDHIAPVADVTNLPDIHAECEVTTLTLPTATDNCKGAVIATPNVSLPITAEGTTTVTWTYDDGNGNTSTQTQHVIIKDITAPVPDTTYLADVTADCKVTSLVLPTATDNCRGQIQATTNTSFPITALGTTTVIWTYNDGNGNTSTQTQKVILSSIDMGISMMNDTTLKADATGNYTYQWLDCNNNNTPISGATHQTYTSYQDGFYAAVVSSPNGCSITTACVSIHTTGISEAEQQVWQVYPNPTHGAFTVSTARYANNVCVELFSPIGALIYKATFSGNRLSLHLDDYPKGVYFLKLNDHTIIQLVRE